MQRVVNAIASHRDDLAFALQLCHQIEFVLRLHFAVHFFDAELCRGRSGGKVTQNIS